MELSKARFTLKTAREMKKYTQEEAAKIAIETTLNYLNETNSPIKVIFNVFKDKDFQLYKEALSQHE